MNFEISSDGILKVNIENMTQCDNIVENLISFHKKHPFKKIVIASLVGCNPNGMHTMKQFDVGEGLAKYFKEYHIPIIVEGECQCFTRFTETVAVNRGLELDVQKK